MVGQEEEKEGNVYMAETGIDWDWFDKGPGSESFKRDMARENFRLQAKLLKERMDREQLLVDLEMMAVAYGWEPREGSLSDFYAEKMKTIPRAPVYERQTDDPNSTATGH